MKVDWEGFLRRLRSYPAHVHNILPPCPEERIEAVEEEFGKLPEPLGDMLRHFNGAQLFDRTGYLLTIFGVSAIPPLPPFEWGPDWYIDKFTARWRSCGRRENDWAIAMMCYGVLIVLAGDGCVREWDTSQGNWGPKKWSLEGWLEAVIREGDAYLNE